MAEWKFNFLQNFHVLFFPGNSTSAQKICVPSGMGHWLRTISNVRNGQSFVKFLKLFRGRKQEKKILLKTFHNFSSH